MQSTAQLYPLKYQSSHRQYVPHVNKWVSLFSNKTVFIIEGDGLDLATEMLFANSWYRTCLRVVISEGSATRYVSTDTCLPLAGGCSGAYHLPALSGLPQTPGGEPEMLL